MLAKDCSAAAADSAACVPGVAAAAVGGGASCCEALDLRDQPYRCHIVRTCR